MTAIITFPRYHGSAILSGGVRLLFLSAAWFAVLTGIAIRFAPIFVKERL